MTFDQFNDWVRGSIVLPEHLNTDELLRLLYWSNKLGEESGEVQAVVSEVVVRGSWDFDRLPNFGRLSLKLEDEIGDVFYILLALSKETGVDLERVFAKTMRKIIRRYGMPTPS